MKRAALLALVAAAAVACGKHEPAGLQGYVEGEFVRVAAPFAGTLVRLETARGRPVEAGAPLFALEAGSEEAARREALARAHKAQLQVQDLESGKRPTEIASTQAQLAQAEAAAAFSEKELQRTQDLVARGFVSHSSLDAARATRDRDRNRVAELRAEQVIALVMPAGAALPLQ